MFTYTQLQTVTVRLRVTDPQGATATDAIVVNAGNNTAPVPVINTPGPSLTWRVGDLISFSGSATDTQDGTLPASALSWALVMNHCPSNCHQHPLQTFAGVASGSFNTPDHEYPSFLELKLTATDTNGASATTTLRLNPQTVDLTFLSNPAGLEIAMNGTSAPAPYTRTVIAGSVNTVTAVSPQTKSGNGYTFLTWSDGGAETHSITAGTTPANYTANFSVSIPGPVAAYGFEEASGAAITDSTGTGNNGTMANAVRTTAGKFGSALTFNGSNALVSIPDSASLDLTNSLTLEAWVKPTTLTGAWRTVLLKEQTGNIVYDLYAGRTGSPAAPLSEVFASGSATSAQATTGLALNVWSHLAATYDGSIVRLYVNGTQVATQAAVGDLPNSTGALRIGGNNLWNEWFDGQIDEVRIYGRALTATEIQADMTKAVVNPDSGPPTAPSNLSAIGSLGSVALAWSGSSDDVGVVRYNVHRSTTQGFVPSAANRVAQPTATSFTDSPLAAGTYYYRVTAEDAAGNISTASGESSAVVTGDTTPPTPPANLVATGSLSSVALTWSASSDNVGVLRYNVHRSTTDGFTPSAANRVGQPSSASFTDTGLAAGTYYYRVTAEDAAGNLSALSSQATAAVTGDTSPPTAPASLTATPGSGTASLAWPAATDNVAVARYNVHRSTTNGFTPSAANRIAQPTATSYSDTGLAPGTYYYRVTAEDAAGNVGAASPQASALVTAQPTGLIAAYAFDAGSGTAVADTSGNLNNGTLANGTWSAAGKYGGAIQFNGTSTWVAVPNATSLNPTAGVTMEAWVNPSALTGWRTVMFKEQTGNLTYGVYANTSSSRPNAQVFVAGSDRNVNGTAQVAANVWTHLAATYDGANIRLYVNGTQAATVAQTGAITTSTGVLHIGGNAVWSEWFQGLIDEVRIYNRALSATEIQADMATSIGNQDTSPPTTPAGLGGTIGLSSVALSWTASTDNVGVSRYNVHRSTTQGFTPSAANRIAQPTSPSYSDSPLSPATYYYRVTAEDAAGNLSAASSEFTAAVTGDISAPTQPANLSATGSLSSVALTWNASTDNVGVLRYNVHRGTTPGFTPTVGNRIAQPAGASYSDTGLAAGTYYYRVTAEDAAGNISAASAEANAVVTGDVSPPTVPSNLSAIGSLSSVALAWSGSTDNVAVLRYNLHRSTTQGFTPTVANRIAQPTGTLFTDSPLTAGTYYYRVTAEDAAGNISAPSAEATAVVTGDVTAPTAPANLVATGGLSSVALTWSASSDNVGVVRYNVHRSTTNGFTASAANRIAQPAGTSLTDSPLTPGTYYYRVTAEDAAGNISAVSAQATGVVTGDITAPTAPGSPAAVGSTNSVALTWTASTDNVGVLRYNVHRSTTNGFTPSAANRVAQPTVTSFTDSPLAPATYYYRVTAEDAAGNISVASAQVSATVNLNPPGLVAAYGFDEGSGTNAADSSGSGNNGTVANATWTAAGKYGSALSFNGSNAWVTVPNSTSLNPTAAVTMEAWVNPPAQTGWRTVMFKEQTGNLTYGMYGNTSASRPNAQVFVAGSDRNVNGTAQVAANVWTHLAATYDGANIRLYVNGTLAATVAQSGAITTSTGALHIGGNAVWSEWFVGLIDEVRIYNRALSATEIQADMATSVSTPDSVPPTAPTGLGATGSIGAVTLGWTAATDDVGVARYNVHRGTTPGFTPSAGNRVGQPTGTSFVDGVAAGTYYYRVTAEDAAGNVGPASNEASGTATADTTAPTVSMSAPSNGATVTGTTNVSANASDNVAVAGVQFKLDGANLGAEDTSAPFTVSWDTRTTTNGSHQLSAVARDATGNSTTSSPIIVTVDNTAPPAGLVAGFGFDEGSGTTAGDASGNGNAGAVTGATWVPGRFGNALLFNGNGNWVTVPDSASLDLTTAVTMEAWIYPTALGTDWKTVLFKEQPSNLVYGLYANTTPQRPNAQVFVGGSDRNVNGPSQLPVNTWTHLAATYDGANIRLYVNGAQVAVTAQTGAITTSTGALRIGGNNIWPEWFQGRIDEIRVYNRALSAAEIATDSTIAVARDTTPPTVSAVTPANGSTNLPVSTVATATFSEAMDPTTITTATFELRDGGGTLIPAAVTYDALAAKATLSPTTALLYGTTYTATVKGGTSGSRARDMSGNYLPANVSWSFTLEPVPPPVLLATSAANPFSSYTAEILRGEGLNEFTTVDASLLSPAFLNYFDVVVLGDTPLNASAVSALTGWVNAGGNLIALRPDKQLAGLLGLSDAGGTLANAYMLVNTVSGPGVGIVGQTMQFHGTADRYVLNGATSVATLYSNASTSTVNPAVTLRSVGASGGQAAAFTYDLARSVVYTRQGNPAWAGQERDGILPIRPDDLFFGAAAGDPQPNWVDVSKIAIPQADEQQRLLANLITSMARDRKPMPRFWYLPRGEKAAVVMTGDDHAQGGTAGRFDHYMALSPAGCSVVNWECIRGTSYIYSNSPLTNAQASSYVANGFEVALHLNTAGGPCGNWTPGELNNYYVTQLALFNAKYTSVPASLTERTHCVAWSDWITQPKTMLNYGMRLDTNYYHYPDTWIGGNPGFMTGSGLLLRFADIDGSVVNVRQANTFMTDESGQSFPSTVNALLDKAVGVEGYYGLFTANMHTDLVDSPGSESIITSALARSVPVITAKQALDWVEGRDASTFREFSWSGNTLTFRITVAAGANGLEALLPMAGPGGTLSAVSRSGTPVFTTTRTIKGVDYAAFTAVSGVYTAVYGG